MGLLRRSTSLALPLAFTLLACSSFGADTTTPDDVEAGKSDAADDGGSSDASAPGEAGLLDAARPDGGGDGGPDPSSCVAFTALPPGWTIDASGGGTLSQSTYQNRPALVATAMAGGHRAVAVRNLPQRADGKLVITVDLAVSAANAGGVVGWLLDLVKVRCSSPDLSAIVALDPSGGLDSEAAPSQGPPATFPLAAGWQELKLSFDGSAIGVTYAGTSKTIQTTSSFANRVGCTLELGVDAIGNAPSTTAAYARACVE